MANEVENTESQSVTQTVAVVAETPVDAPDHAAAQPVTVEPVAALPVAVDAVAAAPKLRRARKAKVISAGIATVDAAPAKAAVKRAAKARPAASSKSVPKKAASKAAQEAGTVHGASAPSLSQLKDKIMATKNIEDFSALFTGNIADVQEKAKAAFDKTTAAVAEATDFAKGNVEAVVQSGKIVAEALKDLGNTLATDGKTAFETMTADAKELAAVKSPADFFKLQGEIMRRAFDNAVALGSKNTEMFMKLAGDAAAPLSTRVSVAMEKAKKAA